jgi:polyadenylate-binding protein
MNNTGTAAATSSGSLPIASLYVGDLSPDVTEAMLFEKFSQIGPVLSIRVCRDVVTRRSLGYAYVNFQNPTDAEKAIDTLNFEPIKGDKPMRIMWTQRDPSLRKSGVGNIFIKNLDKNIDNKALCDTFGAFGKILSCKIALDDKGKSLGYGFVHYEKQESADASMVNLNGKLLNDKQVFVGPFIPKKERDRATEGKRKFTNLYVKHIRDDVSDDQLKELFGKYGSISSVYLQRDVDGRSKRFGFVSFEDPEDANTAMSEMQGRDDYPEIQEGKKLYIAPAKKKAERQAELRDRFEKIKMERANRYQGVNLYIKNLDDDIDDAELRKAFEQFGTVTSAKVMLTENDVSRGFGFVCFSSPEEATKAVTEMNGRILKSKPLYVALAQRKEERQLQLNQMYSQRTIPGVRIGPGAQLPAGIYPTAAAAAGGSFFMPPTAMAPAAAQRSFFPQMAAGVRPSPRWPTAAAQMRPGAQPGPNAFTLAGGQPQYRAAPPRASLNQPNIRGAPAGVPQSRMPMQNVMRMGPPGSHMGMGVMQNQAGMPNMAQMQAAAAHQQNAAVAAAQAAAVQQANAGMQPQRNMKYQPGARNVPTGVPPGSAPAAGQPGSKPGKRTLDPQQLAMASTASQKQTLGEHLYPIIADMQGMELAGRITGMLLELDNSDLIDMLQAHDDGGEELRKKVDEAVAVIKAHAAKEAVNSVTRVAMEAS